MSEPVDRSRPLPPPSLRPPTADEVRDLARDHYLDPSDEAIQVFTEVIAEALQGYERLEELPEPTPERRYTERDPGYRPGRDEDPHNAVVTRCRVPGADGGPLAGYEVGLKDMIAVAGVEMTCGSRLFDDYVPTRDAAVTTRLLDAGATVTAKLNMDDLAVSGAGDTPATGPVLNPHDIDYLAGGSSGGSAVAVVTGDVDVALGTDQAGSVRIPAALCGCVGLKPTHGLVPYTGILAGGYTFDHVGPLARTVRDCAVTLDTIAGPDPGDPRQGQVEPADHAEAVADADPEGIALAVVEEGFGLETSDDRVDETVRDALDRFAAAGASLDGVSVPWHLDGPVVWRAVANGEQVALANGEGVGRSTGGYYDAEFAEAYGRARRVHGDDSPPNRKLSLVLAQYLFDEYLGRHHAKAQNLRPDLRAAYDDALADADVLAMPTVPITAHECRDLTLREWFDRPSTIWNTAPFDVTGHPAISVPAGTVDGLPVGLMLVGERGADEEVLRVAAAYEQAVGWEDLRLDDR